MGHALKRQDYLSLLANSKQARRRNSLIELATPSEIKAVAECILNVINKNIPIDEKTIKCLNKHKNVLRRLTKAKLSTNSRKKLLRQKGGGFLATILPIALSALTSLLVKK